MSGDFRVSELERIGASVLDVGIADGDAVEALVGGWRVRWQWGSIEVAPVRWFDRWANSRVAMCEVSNGDDVLRVLRAMSEGGETMGDKVKS